jgi:hypothetical protein
MKSLANEKHRDTLAILRETLDYLQRLPSVPTTTALCERIKKHLDDPGQQAIAEFKSERIGYWITSTGMTMFEASLIGDQLKVTVPDPVGKDRNQPTIQKQTREYIAAMILKKLTEPAGVTIKLVKPSKALEQTARR